MTDLTLMRSGFGGAFWMGVIHSTFDQ
jgi:hypothetical protein